MFAGVWWNWAPQLLRIRHFFHGLHHETIILLFLLGAAVVCTFCGVALICYALLVGQALEEGGEFLVGVGMVAAGAIFGAIAVISSIVARFHRKVMALEDGDEETGATSAQHKVSVEHMPYNSLPREIFRPRIRQQVVSRLWVSWGELEKLSLRVKSERATWLRDVAWERELGRIYPRHLSHTRDRASLCLSPGSRNTRLVICLQLRCSYRSHRQNALTRVCV